MDDIYGRNRLIIVMAANIEKTYFRQTGSQSIAMVKNNQKKDRHIVLLAPPDTALLDVAGPCEVFSRAAMYINSHPEKFSGTYNIHVISTVKAKVINTSAGLPIVCEGNLKSINYEIDTLLVTGTPGISGNITDRARIHHEAIQWLRDHHQEIKRVGSVCAGAFMLAEAGLLNGRRATTHWECCTELSQQYPGVTVDPDPIFIKDGNVYTSAGISSGMDLALALVEEDFGRELALYVARRLVLFLKRPGNQSQFSAILEHQKTDHQPIHDLLNWILEHLDKELTVEILAEKASMSPRNFARVFVRETGLTPAKYIEKLRLETARRRLEETRLTVDEISGECGLGSADTLRRLFIRHLKTTPTDYRRNFRTALV